MTQARNRDNQNFKLRPIKFERAVSNSSEYIRQEIGSLVLKI